MLPLLFYERGTHGIGRPEELKNIGMFNHPRQSLAPFFSATQISYITQISVTDGLRVVLKLVDDCRIPVRIGGKDFSIRMGMCGLK